LNSKSIHAKTQAVTHSSHPFSVEVSVDALQRRNMDGCTIDAHVLVMVCNILQFIANLQVK